MDNETAGSLLNEYRELKAGRECLKAKMETGRRKLEEAAKRLGDSPEHGGWEPIHGPDPKAVRQHPSPEESNPVAGIERRDSEENGRVEKHVQGTRNRNQMKSRRKPKLDPSIERDGTTEKDLADVFGMLLRDAPDRPRSRNREPTREELDRRWKLERR